jgi:putative zinc finger/helix-turn-helix YgiT family protein
MNKCVNCNCKSLKKSSTTERVVLSGITFTGKVPATECAECGESYVALDDLGDFELAVSERLASLGVRTGETFKYMRKALGLRAIDLAELLGIAPETISRWENGEPEEHAFVLLGGMVADRVDGRDSTVKRLRAMRSPGRRPAKVTVRAA